LGKKHIYVTSIILVILLIPPIGSINQDYQKHEPISEDAEPIKPIEIADLGLHDPIAIFSDADFDIQGWPGSGTEGDPYVISSYRFEDENAIIIANILFSYFEIRNCQFVIDSPSWYSNSLEILPCSMPFLVQGCLFDGGNFFVGSNDGEVVGCVFQNVIEVAIDGSNAEGVTYRLNIFEDCGRAMLFGATEFSNTVYQNTIENCGVGIQAIRGYFHHNTFVNCDVGVDCSYPSTATVSDNTFQGCTLAYHHRSSSSKFYRNNITNCERGIEIRDLEWQSGSIINNSIDCTTMNTMSIRTSNSMFIYGNNFSKGGIWLDAISAAANNNTIVNNLVGGKPILYLNNIVNQEISDDYGQIIIALAGNVTVTNCNISSVIAGVQLLYSNNSYVKNCSFSDSDIGVHLSGSTNCVVANSNFSLCGVVIEGTEDWHFPHIITDCFVNSKPLGFFRGIYNETVLNPDDYGQIILYNCTEFVIEGGTIHNASMGIGILGCGEILVNSTTLLDNKIFGIQLQIVRFCNFTQNEISHSSIGISMGFCGFNTLQNNTILSCDEGFYLSDATHNNEIYFNTIGYCTIRSARAGSNSNQWDDGVSVGNWWADWDGTNLYEIYYDGTFYPDDYFIVDRFPNGSLIDTDLPIIYGPDDFSINLGESGYSIEWTIIDEWPDAFFIYRDQYLWVENDFQLYDSPEIFLDFIGNLPGTFNFTIVVVDHGLNYVNDTVTVTVVDPDVLPTTTTTTTTSTSTTSTTSTGTGIPTIPSNPWLPNPLTLGISITSAGVIVVMLILSRRALKKRNE